MNILLIGFDGDSGNSYMVKLADEFTSMHHQVVIAAHNRYCMEASFVSKNNHPTDP